MTKLFPTFFYWTSTWTQKTLIKRNESQNPSVQYCSVTPCVYQASWHGDEDVRKWFWSPVRRQRGKLWVMCLDFLQFDRLVLALRKNCEYHPPAFIYIFRCYLASVCRELRKTWTTERLVLSPNRTGRRTGSFWHSREAAVVNSWRKGHLSRQNIKYQIYFLDQSTQDFLAKLLNNFSKITACDFVDIKQ